MKEYDELIRSMCDSLYYYAIDLANGVPHLVFMILLLVCCLGLFLFLVVKGLQDGVRCWFQLLFVEYVFVLFSYTVFFRTSLEERGYDFRPFWSYVAILEGEDRLLPENIMNIIVFIPVGLLLGSGFVKLKWWQALGIGCGISVSIEAMQFVTCRGFSELDDVMHNTLGCLIGYGIISLIRFGYERFSKSNLGIMSYLFWPQRRPEKYVRSDK